MGMSVEFLHELFFNLEHGERLSARLTLNPYLAVGGAARRRHGHGRGQRDHQSLAAGAGNRSDRSQCAARRPDVAARQHHRCGADGVVERGRRIGRPRGRLHAVRQRHRLAHGQCVSAAPRRPAHPGRLRRRRRHCRRVRRAARRRLLRLRADHRQLFAERSGAGRHRVADGLSRRATARTGRARRRRSRENDHRRSRYRACRHARPARGGAGHHSDAGCGDQREHVLEAASCGRSCAP